MWNPEHLEGTSYLQYDEPQAQSLAAKHHHQPQPSTSNKPPASFTTTTTIHSLSDNSPLVHACTNLTLPRPRAPTHHVLVKSALPLPHASLAQQRQHPHRRRLPRRRPGQYPIFNSPPQLSSSLLSSPHGNATSQTDDNDNHPQFSLGFFVFVDAATYSHSALNGSVEHVNFVDWIPLICSVLGMLVINSIEKTRLSADAFLLLRHRRRVEGATRAVPRLRPHGWRPRRQRYGHGAQVFSSRDYPLRTMYMGVANVVSNGLVMLRYVSFFFSFFLGWGGGAKTFLCGMVCGLWLLSLLTAVWGWAVRLCCGSRRIWRTIILITWLCERGGFGVLAGCWRQGRAIFCGVGYGVVGYQYLSKQWCFRGV